MAHDDDGVTSCSTDRAWPPSGAPPTKSHWVHEGIDSGDFVFLLGGLASEAAALAV